MHAAWKTWWHWRRTKNFFCDERLQANDLNFMLIYDILEAFHTDSTKGKQIYKRLEKCLKEVKLLQVCLPRPVLGTPPHPWKAP